jgi:hypothetical protein
MENALVPQQPKKRGRLRARYGYVLGFIFVLAIIGGVIGLAANHGRLPDADRAIARQSTPTG